MMSAVFYVFLIFISINLDECVFDSDLKEITIGNMTKVITIPGHPRPFYSNRTLHWQITTESKNKVVSLRTDPLLNTNSTNCFLIYDGIVRTYRVISRWCLGTKESYVTRGRVMHLILQSNGTIPPFKLFLSERNKVECNAGFIWTTRLAQYITSPFYPGHYPSYIHCLWYIKRHSKVRGIEIKIHHLELGNKPNTCGDFLWITDVLPSEGKICNSTDVKFSYVSKENMVAIAFHSDGSHSAKGFNISYETFNSDGNCNLDIDVYTFDGYLIPLNYPHWFKRGLKCVYRLHKAKKFASNYKIVVSVVFCDLPPKVNQQCTIDYVNVYDGSVKNSQDKVGTFCGNENNFTVRANSTSVLIDFVTAANSSGTTAENSSGYYKGFRIKYMLEEITRKITCSVERPLQLTASTTVQYFTSPNYPNNYENDQYCQWRITTANYKTIRFEVIDSDLGPKPAHDDADYVKVYDDKNIRIKYSPHKCGYCQGPDKDLDAGYNRKGDLLGKLYSTYTPTYVSSDFYLFIEFKSNSNGVYKGFKVKYYTTSDSVPNSLPDSVSVEISLIDTSAGAIGGIVSTIAFLIICMCVILRDPCRIRKNRQRRQSRQSSQTVVYDANSTSSPPPYSEVRYPEYDIAPPSYPENIPSVAPPPYSELPAYEDAAINYEIAESRSHPESNTVTEPKRQISRDDLRIRRNPQSELPTYEDSANYEIRETRGHPEQNPVPEPQRQTSRDDLRRRNSQSELPA